MPDSILGLPTSAKYQSAGDRFNAHRRQILNIAPNGGSPLTALLSMIPSEPLTDSIYYWYEKRFKVSQAALRGTNPVTTTAPTDGDTDDGTAVTATSVAITTALYIKVDTTRDLHTGQILIPDTNHDILFRIKSIVRGVADETAKGYVVVNLQRATTLASIATTFAAGTILRVTGSTYGEGQTGVGVTGSGVKRPYRVENTTQIFRDSFSFPGTVLQMGLKYDQTGPYKQKARDTVLDHFVGIERSILFGKRATATRNSFDSNQEDLTTRTFSGILEFLKLWDAGSTGLTVDGATYAPYGFKAASTVDSDDEKRFITNATGDFTVKDFDVWTERACRYRSNKSPSKLMLVGSGASLALTEMFRRNGTFQVDAGKTAYGLSLKTLVTPSGNFEIVTHPLFNDDPVLRYSALVVDLWDIMLRPLQGRDTQLLPNRQNPGDDLRKDEYLSELGLEVHAPERHMFIKNLRNYKVA